MGRKIRSIVCLILVLTLIYMQQSVIYAKEEEPKSDVEETVQEESDKTIEETVQKGSDKTIEETMQKDEEQTTEKNMEEDQEEKVEKFQVEISEPDGDHGYYVSAPQVSIHHASKTGMTKYEVWAEDQIVAEEVLDEADSTTVLEEEVFREGNNQLYVYMEDTDGHRIPEYEFHKELFIDTQVPEVAITAPGGFDTWYKKEAWIHVAVADQAEGSQVESIICYQGNQMIGRKHQIFEQEGADFLITQTSNSGNGVNVTVSVKDYAGNKVEKTVKLFIDNAPPEIQVEGVRDYMITGDAVVVQCMIKDDNQISAGSIVTERETPFGELVEEPTEVWGWERLEGYYEQTFEEDGIYRVHIEAADAAGYVAEQQLQFIIDRTNPVIRHVDELDGQYLKEFIWNYPGEAYIDEFTSYTKQVLLDGRLYPEGNYVTSEGQHVLQVDVVDSAGNEASAYANFVIDHTSPEIIFANVEDGAEYELEKTFYIRLADESDSLTSVHMNGMTWDGEKENEGWRYEVNSPGDYEVEVQAMDRAGNQSSANLSFKINPEKTLFEKMVQPVKEVFEGSKTEQSDQGKKKINAEKKDKGMIRVIRWMLITVIIVGGGALSFAVGYHNYKKKYKSDPRE